MRVPLSPSGQVAAALLVLLGVGVSAGDTCLPRASVLLWAEAGPHVSSEFTSVDYFCPGPVELEEVKHICQVHEQHHDHYADGKSSSLSLAWERQNGLWGDDQYSPYPYPSRIPLCFVPAHIEPLFDLDREFVFSNTGGFFGKKKKAHVNPPFSLLFLGSGFSVHTMR